MTRVFWVALSIVVVCVAGLAIITSNHFNARLRELEGQHAQELGVRVATLRKEDEITRAALSASILAASTRLESKIDAIGAPPEPAVIANLIINEHLPTVAETVARKLVEEHASDLRGPPGKDADVEELARSLTSTDTYPLLLQAVGEEIWATRARSILGDPNFIATIASEVHERYGRELTHDQPNAEMIATIARMLAREPNFAELVAAEQALVDRSP